MRFSGRRTALTLLLSASVLLACAGPALAGNGKKPKPPRYAAAMSMTGHMSADIDCEAWTTNFTYSGTYATTALESTASLDAKSRSASGTVDWSRNVGCGITPEFGSCGIAAMEPFGGAGDEEAFLQKAAGGLRVEVEFIQFLEIVGDECHGAVYGPGGLGAQNTDPSGFIPRSKVGRKVITVPIAGSFTLVDGSDHSEGQLNGTVTLTRKGKKKGKS